MGTIKRSNLQITGVPEEKREKGAESLFKEIMAEDFPNLEEDLDIQVHKAHSSSNKLHLRRSSPRQTIITLSKIKDKKRLLKQQEKSSL